MRAEESTTVGGFTPVTFPTLEFGVPILFWNESVTLLTVMRYSSSVFKVTPTIVVTLFAYTNVAPANDTVVP